MIFELLITIGFIAAVTAGLSAVNDSYIADIEMDYVDTLWQSGCLREKPE